MSSSPSPTTQLAPPSPASPTRRWPRPRRCATAWSASAGCRPRWRASGARPAAARGAGGSRRPSRRGAASSSRVELGEPAAELGDRLLTGRERWAGLVALVFPDGDVLLHLAGDRLDEGLGD